MKQHKIELDLSNEIYWSVREASAGEQMDEEAYVKSVLRDELGIESSNSDDATSPSFGEFVVRQVGSSGDAGRANIRSLAQYIYDHWNAEDPANETDGSGIPIPPWDIWNEATKTRAEEASAGRDDRDAETYRSTVRGTIYRVGFDSGQDFRNEIGRLVAEYDSYE